MKTICSPSFCEEIALEQSPHVHNGKRHTLSSVRVLLGLAIMGLTLMNVYIAQKSTLSLTAAVSEIESGMTDDLFFGSISPTFKLSATLASSSEIRQRRTQVQQRNITFLGPSDRGSWVEAYSGMWWQHRNHFLQTDWHSGFTEMPIGGSWKVLRGKRSRQTRDWLDFSVEHLSIFWKHFSYRNDSKDDLVYSTIEDTLDRYINSTEALDIPQSSAAPFTIAIIPFFAKENKTDSSIKEKALSATLVSLWQIGIGRSIIVASSDDEERMVGRIFDSLRPKFEEYPMQIAFHRPDNISEKDKKLMPKVALGGLKLAMVGNFSESLTEKWLGSDPSRWKFVYFSEPDLILHARQSAMASIRRELRQGGVLSAHRFMPLPHQRSFPGYDRLDKVIPDIGQFSFIHEVDGNAGDACCDAGKYYPSNPVDPRKPEEFFPCKPGFLMWWRCGFFRGNKNYTDIATVSELHRRVTHPLISLAGGTGFPLIHNNQKVCFPKKLGACD